MSSSSNPVIVGALLGSACLAVGAFLGLHLGNPPAAPEGLVDTSALETKLDRLERAVASLTRERVTPLVATSPAQTPVPGNSETSNDATPTPLVTISNAEILAALIELNRRMDAFDVSLPKALRPTGEDGIPSKRKPMNTELIVELLSGERADAAPRFTQCTYVQVYEALGGPTWIGKDEHGIYWAYDVEGGKWPRLNVWFVDGMCSMAYAP